MTDKEPPRNMNPLWIISLFLGLSEVTVGVVATQASGWIQGLLAVFSMVFPIGTAMAFFYVLWHKPYVLYAPRDYSKDTNVATFVDAMTVSRLSRKSHAREIDIAVRSTVETVMENYAVRSDGWQDQSSMEQAVRESLVAFERMHVYIDSSEAAALHVGSVPGNLRIPIPDEMTVQEFLDEVWSKLYPAFEPYVYGRQWMLEHVKDGGWLISERSVSESAKMGGKGDDRDLRETGVRPGETWKVVLLS